MGQIDQINILVAEDNDLSREMIARIIRMQGYRVLEARDGGTALELARQFDVHVAVIDQMMEPVGGFHFAQRVAAGGLSIPIIMVTAHDASDILLEASKCGIQRVIQKPFSPDKLVGSINRILAQKGVRTRPLTTVTYETRHNPEQLMRQAIELAAQNRKFGKGGPFGAIIADAEGRILGEGSNGIAARSDPTAHAEVMAIRQASERLGRTDLSDCFLYCSSEPTKVGRALISSVGITKVHYGLSHKEVAAVLGAPKPEPDTEYVRFCHEDALAMMQSFGKKEPGGD
ncbi:MAG: response regulator [Alphaproteobacteria bacterium]|nr:response regulator [Alphaproteobacteria bacterium]